MKKEYCVSIEDKESSKPLYWKVFEAENEDKALDMMLKEKNLKFVKYTGVSNFFTKPQKLWEADYTHKVEIGVLEVDKSKK